MDATINTQAIAYRGWIIQKETDPWPLKYGMNFMFCQDGDERLNHAATFEEAKDEILEKIMTALPDHVVIIE